MEKSWFERGRGDKDIEGKDFSLLISKQASLTLNYECLRIHVNHFPSLFDLVGISVNPRLEWIQFE